MLVENRNKVYDEIILAHEKSKQENLRYHNQSREAIPDFQENY